MYQENYINDMDFLNNLIVKFLIDMEITVLEWNRCQLVRNNFFNLEQIIGFTPVFTFF